MVKFRAAALSEITLLRGEIAPASEDSEIEPSGFGLSGYAAPAISHYAFQLPSGQMRFVQRSSGLEFVSDKWEIAGLEAREIRSPLRGRHIHS